MLSKSGTRLVLPSLPTPIVQVVRDAYVVNMSDSIIKNLTAPPPFCSTSLLSPSPIDLSALYIVWKRSRKLPAIRKRKDQAIMSVKRADVSRQPHIS